MTPWATAEFLSVVPSQFDAMLAVAQRVSLPPAACHDAAMPSILLATDQDRRAVDRWRAGALFLVAEDRLLNQLHGRGR